jgi:hypothetical protein
MRFIAAISRPEIVEKASINTTSFLSLSVSPSRDENAVRSFQLREEWLIYRSNLRKLDMVRLEVEVVANSRTMSQLWNPQIDG